MTPLPLEAAVFDLDGVVTRTERVHSLAWARLFTELLRDRAPRAGEDRRPFESADYIAHVDGRPRLAGVRTFLASRAISVPEGSAGDPPTAETVHGLGARKDVIFHQLLDEIGVEVDPEAVELIRRLRDAGVRVGMATSSRNAATLLARAGLEELFEARVDGIVSAELELRGKPAPDIFLECARRLGTSDPARAMVVEDASAGVAAGRAGGFGLVIGVDRAGNWLALREAGADWIVRDLGALTVKGLRSLFAAREHRRPNALVAWPEIEAALRGRSLAVFLDYDGTLSPIVSRPELAVLDEGTRETLRRLSERWPTAIISGRGREDVQRLAGIDSLWVAGSHGFDIGAPGGGAGGKEVAPEIEPEIHGAAADLADRTAAIPGVLVEDKRFSLAVHYRQVEEHHIPAVERAVDEVAAARSGLRKSYGKKVFQLEPALDWDKGRALLWLIEATGQQRSLPIYIGDDETDEAALAAIAARGLGVVVTEIPRPTAARYSLQDPFEVEIVLGRLAALGAGGAR